jgi:hypothetical protein
MKRIRLFFCLGTVMILAEAGAAVVPGLFNTGVDDSGAPLAPGSADPHYSLTGPLSNAVAVARHFSTNPKYTWVAPPSGSAWLSPNSGGRAPIGLYRYTLRFDLTGRNPDAVELIGEFASDDNATISLNGRDTGCSNQPVKYRKLTPFRIRNGFVPGMNALEFCVTNIPVRRGGNPTALLVTRLATCGQEVQPPATTAAANTSAAPPANPTEATAPSTYVGSSSPAPLVNDPAFGHALPGGIGLTHQVEVSTDLVHWTAATNVVLYFKDLDSTNYSERFYRFQGK